MKYVMTTSHRLRECDRFLYHCDVFLACLYNEYDGNWDVFEWGTEWVETNTNHFLVGDLPEKRLMLTIHMSLLVAEWAKKQKLKRVSARSIRRSSKLFLGFFSHLMVELIKDNEARIRRMEYEQGLRKEMIEVFIKKYRLPRGRYFLLLMLKIDTRS